MAMNMMRRRAGEVDIQEKLSDEPETLRRWTREQKAVRKNLANTNSERGPDGVTPDLERRNGRPLEEQETMQCIAHVNGRQCKLKSRLYGPLCWVHTRNWEGLAVKDSTLPDVVLPDGTVQKPGKGLFALREFKKGEIVIEYMGEHVRSDENPGPTPASNVDYTEGADPNTYGIEFDAENGNLAVYAANTKNVIDEENGEKITEEINSWKPTAGVARYINGRRGNKKAVNVQFSEDPDKAPGRIFVEAIKDIKAGDELFLDYGKEYREIPDESAPRRQSSRLLRNSSSSFSARGSSTHSL